VPVPCPFLPTCGRLLNWRDLNALRDKQGPELYRLCLEYGQQLWLDELPARALLAVDRALYCDVREGDVVLAQHAMPYRAIGWMVRQPSDQFTGNARVHYQHLADRVRGERAELKKWRAWAAWAVTRHVRPDLAGDPRHAVVEPTPADIEAGLRAYGLPSEIAEWRKALAD
jgi:hypothetical protein